MTESAANTGPTTRTGHGFLMAYVGALSLYAGLSVGQESAERVQVAGSRIARVDAEMAAPVTILSRQEIERTGAQTAADVIRALTIDNNGSIPSAFGSGFAVGR